MSFLKDWASDLYERKKREIKANLEKKKQEQNDKRDFKKKIDREEWERYERDKARAKYERKRKNL